jgi:hypothetical protein
LPESRSTFTRRLFTNVWLFAAAGSRRGTGEVGCSPRVEFQKKTEEHLAKAEELMKSLEQDSKNASPTLIGANEVQDFLSNCVRQFTPSGHDTL